MFDPEDGPGPDACPLPRAAQPRLPGERLLRRRPGLSDRIAIGLHPGGILVHRGAQSAVLVRGNERVGAVWLGPDGLWYAAPGGLPARAVSGEWDGDALQALEGWAPSFRDFPRARDHLLGLLASAERAEGGQADARGAEPRAGADGGISGPERGGRRGQVVQFPPRRGPGRRR